MIVPGMADEAKKWLKIILVIIVAILLVVLAFKIYRALKKPVNAKYIKGGGSLPSGWTPNVITDTLFKAIEGIATWTSTKDDAYKKFNALNDNQMIAVYNDWNDRYADKKSWFVKFGTLTEALKDETDYQVFGDVNQMDIMIANLDRLKLS